MAATTVCSPLVLTGALTIYRAAEIKAQLLTALAREGALQLELGEVEEMDLAGVQLLVLAEREALASGKDFALLSQSDAVREVLTLAGLQRNFAPSQSALAASA